RGICQRQTKSGPGVRCSGLRGRPRCRQLVRGIGKSIEELTGNSVNVEAYGRSVCPNEGAPEDTRRPAGHIVRLQRREQCETDLRFGGDGFEWDLPPFAFAPKP